jgi:hypothetical protein
MAVPINANTPAGAGGNRTAVSSAMSSRQQATPTAGTDPRQLGGGGGKPSPQAGAPALGESPVGAMLQQVWQKIVQNGFQEVDLNSVVDFLQTLEATVNQQGGGQPPQPQGPGAQAPAQGPAGPAQPPAPQV